MTAPMGEPANATGNVMAAANVNAEATEGCSSFSSVPCAPSQRPARGEAL